MKASDGGQGLYMDKTALQSLAGALAGAHKSGVRLDNAALPQPASIAEAYFVHAEVMRILGTSPAGWKVGLRPEAHGVGAPLMAALMFPSDAPFRIAHTEGTGVEIELALRLRAALPVRPAPYTRADVIAAAGEWLIGFEWVDTRVRERDTSLLVFADNMANGGYIVGSGVAALGGLEAARLRCSIMCDGIKVHDAIGGHPSGDPLIPVIAFANAQDRPPGSLESGHIVTTGSLNGILPVRRTTRLQARLEGIGALDVLLRPAAPGT